MYIRCVWYRKKRHTPKAGCEAFGVCRMIRILYLSVCYWHPEPYEEKSEGYGWHYIKNKLNPFTFLNHGKCIMAEGGERGETSAETCDEKGIHFRAHLMSCPKSGENADDETSYNVHEECPGGILVTKKISCRLSLRGIGMPCRKNLRLRLLSLTLSWIRCVFIIDRGTQCNHWDAEE